MRLINCETMEFEMVDSSNAPSYAILSHTWEEEVTFQDFCDTELRQMRQGWQKIASFCLLAQAHGWCYAWVDCCCINKESSAELSEAINSMFTWYGCSSECYAYLPDCDASQKITSSRYFTRGWTLQELIAPSNVTFYDKNWASMGTRTELSSQISTLTHIDEEILNNTSFGLLRGLLDSCTIAMRMSWAAKRVTRRPEDMAYCLLGLFGISTPMLYGEGGERAFVRLQEEIIKDSNDMSIFAWKEELSSVVMYHTDTKETSVPLRGILAKSPREFLNAHYYKIDTGRNSSAEYAMTNKGLRMTVELELGRQDSLPLNCYIKKTNYNVPVPLAIVLEARANGVYARRDAQSLTTSTQPSRGVAKLIYVSKLSVGSVKWAVEKHSRVQIRFEYVKLQKDHFSCDVIGRGPDERWDTTSEAFHMAQYQYSLTCYERIIWRSQTGESGEFAVIAGVDASKKPWACVATMKHTPALYHAVQRNEIISIERHRNEAALPKYVLKSKWPKSICAHLSLQKAETLEGSQVRFKYLVTVKVQNEVGR